MRLLLSAILLTITAPATAQIYQYTDMDGRQVFTDQQPLGVDATTVELRTSNSISATESRAQSTNSTAHTSAKKHTFYTLLQLSGLPTNQAIRANDGRFTVQVEISPNLAKQHRLQLLIDGKVYGAATTATTLQIENIDRGEHRLAVQVLTNDKVIQRSTEQTFNVQRVHINRPKPSTQ